MDENSRYTTLAFLLGALVGTPLMYWFFRYTMVDMVKPELLHTAALIGTVLCMLALGIALWRMCQEKR